MAGILIQWYDFICFGIVGIAMFGALYVLCCCKIKQQRYQTLNGDHIDDHNIIGRQEILLPLQGCHPSSSSAVEMGSLSSSCWRGIHPAWLLATRFISLVVLCIFLTWDVLLYNYSIFVYYTEWTFTLLIVYFAIGTIISAYGCVRYYSNKLAPRPGDVIEDINSLPKDCVYTRTDHEIDNKAKTNKSIFKLQGQYYNEDTVPQRATFWSYVLQISYQTCAGSVILTDIIFWFIILPFSSNSHLQLNLLMGGMHSLNIIFLLIDTFLNSLPLPWAGLAYFVLWSCCYIIFQWLIHACGLIWWPYPFLELSTPWAPLWYFCLAVFHLPCYGIYWLLVTFKNLTFSTLFPQAFIRHSY
ncbi:uncharacterized protein [Nicotiana tomentosiformis]|uniref:uncharacterized protein n=1 Tax=Nicotiana tomentosiformis TaxID=4098 RepID=UPI00388C96A7